MGLLQRIFHIPTSEERNGAHLDLSKLYWILEGKTTFPHFLHALCRFAPEGSILCLEDGSPIGSLKQFLDEKSIPEQLHIALGTLWPMPVCFHIPATPDNLAQLAELVSERIPPEVASHVHLYARNSVVLEWHDAFDQDMYIDGAVDKESVRSFADALSMTLRLSDSNG